MEYRLRHPSDPKTYALYGVDPETNSYWVKIVERLVIDAYDRRTGRSEEVKRHWVRDHYDPLSGQYDIANPIRGLLLFLSEAGFFAFDDIREALDIIQEQGVDGLPQRLRRVGRVLQNLDRGLA